MKPQKLIGKHYKSPTGRIYKVINTVGLSKRHVQIERLWDGDKLDVHIDKLQTEFKPIKNPIKVTLYIKTLRDSVLYGDEVRANADFDAQLPIYIDRLKTEIGKEVDFNINETELSLSSLVDDRDGQLAAELTQQIQFWD